MGGEVGGLTIWDMFPIFLRAKLLLHVNMTFLCGYVCVEDIFWPIQSRGCPSNIKLVSNYQYVLVLDVGEGPNL